MDEILRSVEQVTASWEISTASADQRAGIEQVHEAIAQIDSVTQQNSALVEQASAAAGSFAGTVADARKRGEDLSYREDLNSGWLQLPPVAMGGTGQPRPAC